MNRFLSKSRFALALECATKLYYHSHPEQYPNTREQNDFLQALAEGGFQVNALARAYYPDGILIEEPDPLKAVWKTAELLKLDEVVLFEAAFIYRNYYIRADIVQKRGKHLQLIEVKAKSADDQTEFTGKKGDLISGWRKYVYDVAYQKYVMQGALTEYNISSYLMLVNKSSKTTVEGLNQRFFLQQENGRTSVVTIGDISPEALGERILVTKNVDDIVERIYKGKDRTDSQASFENMITEWAQAYEEGRKIYPQLSGICKKCEYKADDEQKRKGMKSGFEECWKEHAGFGDDDFKKPLVLDMWNYRRKDEVIRGGRYFQEELNTDDFKENTARDGRLPGWSNTDRHIIQVNKSKAHDNTPEIDRDVMKNYMSLWLFPLHMIDFETTAVAIPFNKGRRPYEQVAFQFSHHTIDENGSVAHKGQWINTTPGKFPNFEFIRALKDELEHDEGTIFRYALHENTVLRVIKQQLQASDEPDRDELIRFINTITHSSNDDTEQWTGERDMVDLLDVVKRCYYHPATNGSNSLKYVLPAVVNSSEFLQQKYSNADYGVKIPSLNFSHHQWLRKNDAGEFINPYNTLPQIHEGIDNEQLDDLQFSDNREIVDGGAAMTAYARMQFTQMGDEERKRITDALLRYCELDTLGMVMLYEAWREWCH